MPASDIEAFKANLKLMLMSKIGSYENDLFQLVKPQVASGTITVLDMDGAGNFTAQSGVAAPADSKVYGFGSTSNPVVREMTIPLTEKQLRDAPAAAAQVASLGIQRIWNDIADDGFGLIFNGRATAHPLNGVAGSPIVANGGGTMYFVDNFDVTPINGASGFSQTNDHSLTLSATNLRTLLTKRSNWLDKDAKASKPRLKPWLVVVPELGGVAKNLFEQRGMVYDGTGLVEGFSDELAGVIVAPRGATASTTSWALVWQTPKLKADGSEELTCPIMLQLAAMPTVRVQYVPGSGVVQSYFSYESDAYYHPNEGDLFFSKP